MTFTPGAVASGTSVLTASPNSLVADAGTYATTMASTLAQSKTITAAFNATSVTGTAIFVAGPAASSASTLTATPGSVQANNRWR